MRCCGSRHAAGQHITPHNLSHRAAVASAPGRQHQQQHAAAWGLAQPFETLNVTPRAALVARIQQQRGVYARTVVVCVSNGASPSASTATTVSSPSSSTSEAAAAATGLGSDSSRNSDSSSGGSEAGVSKQQQQQDASNTWEEEIEETLKLVQLLPPSGE